MPDHPHVVAEVLAAELGADAHLARELQNLLLHLAVADGDALVVALARQVVEIARRGELHRLEVHLRRGAADHDGEVVGRAGRGAQGADLGVEELQQRGLVQHRRRLLVEVALVGRAAALGDEQELVGVAVGRIDVDLRRQVGAGLHFLEHRDRRDLGIAQVGLGVGLEHAPGDRRLVAAAGPHRLALLAHDDGGAGVLAHRQHAARRDVGVLQELERHVLVVGRGLAVVEDRAQLGEMAGPQEMGDVVEGLGGEQGQRLGLDRQHVAAVELGHADMVGGELAVGRRVLTVRKHLLELELGHTGLLARQA